MQSGIFVHVTGAHNRAGRQDGCCKAMTKRLKRASFWIRRRSHIPLILISGLMVAVLFFDEDTSISLNMAYDRQIDRLKEEIKQNRDSAAYYRSQREALVTGTHDLEHIAREQYHMQRPTEDVFILK